MNVIINYIKLFVHILLLCFELIIILETGKCLRTTKLSIGSPLNNFPLWTLLKIFFQGIHCMKYWKRTSILTITKWLYHSIPIKSSTGTISCIFFYILETFWTKSISMSRPMINRTSCKAIFKLSKASCFKSIITFSLKIKNNVNIYPTQSHLTSTKLMSKPIPNKPNPCSSFLYSSWSKTCI